MVAKGKPMPLTRLTYYSHNDIDPAAGSSIRTLNSILSASNRNNKQAGLTGALIFDDMWFLQVLEGEREAVWRTFERIRDDERHDNAVVAELVETEARMFGAWSMGLATRKPATELLFTPFSRDGRLDPPKMSAAQMLALISGVSRLGLSRELDPFLAA